MGHLGRITTLADLPPGKTLTAYIKKAVALNDEGITEARAPKTPGKPVRVPAGLAAALKNNKKAQAAFDNFRRSHRREYVEWITDAKTDQTRARRLKTAVEQMAEGKSQNWKGNTRRKQGPGARGLKAGAGPGSFASGTGGLRRS